MVVEVDSVLSADPGVPSGTPERSYRYVRIVTYAAGP
jgi:hypothetical protein